MNNNPIPMIELEEVTKKYGTKTAVRHLTLTVEAGELFAFLGPDAGALISAAGDEAVVAGKRGG